MNLVELIKDIYSEVSWMKVRVSPEEALAKARREAARELSFLLPEAAAVKNRREEWETGEDFLTYRLVVETLEDIAQLAVSTRERQGRARGRPEPGDGAGSRQPAGLRHLEGGEKASLNQENLTLKVDPQAAPALFGQYDQNLRQIAEELGIDLTAQDNIIYLSGENEAVNQALAVLEQLKAQVENGIFPGPSEVRYALSLVKSDNKAAKKSDFTREVVQVTNRGKKIYPRTIGQKQYIDAIRENNLTFGIGPAGTGKTYLAVTMAVAALHSKEVARIVLTRPAVEAGEKLGFLPGDLQEKVDPYLRPLYDALFDLFGNGFIPALYRTPDY